MTIVALIEGLIIFLLLTSHYLVRASAPRISLKSPCPACGYKGSWWIPWGYSCTLKFDRELVKVKRECIACRCEVTQPVVYPDLFKASESAKK